MVMNPKIEKKLKALCGKDENVFECLKELFYFELIEQTNYTTVYDDFIKQYSEGWTSNADNKD